MPPEGSVLPGVPPLTTPQQEEFLTALRKSLDVFTNRMRVCSQRGRPVATDSTLQALFKTLHQMNLQLMQYSSDLETRRSEYSVLSIHHLCMTSFFSELQPVWRNCKIKQHR